MGKLGVGGAILLLLFLLTFGALAAGRFDEFVKIFFIIVVKKFFASFDFTKREDINPATKNFYLAVGPAGVVDITSSVTAF